MDMHKWIVVGVDGSASAKKAVRWAARNAAFLEAPLLLATSYTVPQFLYAEGLVPAQELLDDLRNSAEEWIVDAVKEAREVAPDLEIRKEIREGSPIDMLLDLSVDVAEIVVGSRGLGGLSGLVLGSVSTSVVSHADCPVVVVPKTVVDSTGPVVVGVDGSEISSKAIEMGFKEAAARQVPLIAVHAWAGQSFQASLVGVHISTEQWEHAAEEHRRILSEQLAGYANQYPEVTVEKVVLQERPVDALLDAAPDAQLFVVGSHGRGGFAGMLLGSTSRSLLQIAKAPVMVVRPKQSQDNDNAE